MSAPRYDTTIVDANSPLAVDMKSRARALLDATLAMSVKLHQPGETPDDHLKQSISHALQAVIHQAIQLGATEDDVFVAAVSACGWFTAIQRLTPDRVVFGIQFTSKMLKAAEMHDAAKQVGFPTQGARMSAHRIIGSEAFEPKPIMRSERQPSRPVRGGFRRWLTFLAAVWLPSKPPLKRI